MFFEFSSVSKISFGIGRFSELPKLVAGWGNSALIIFNGTGHSADDTIARLQQMLTSSNVRSTSCKQSGEPTVEDIDRAVAVGKSNQVDFVIGIGGGSAIDAAKATAGLLSNGGAAIDYMEIIGAGRKITAPALPWLAIPTTAGTGAEVTRNAVVGSPKHNYKASIRSDYLLAKAVLIDPELNVNVPANVTAASGMDAVCQLIESFTSNAANPMSDALALPGLRLAFPALRKSVANLNDVDARSDMAVSAMWSGITLMNAGLGAVHGFASPFSARDPVAHGVICARLLPAVIKANVAQLRAENKSIERYVQIGKIAANREHIPDELAIAILMEWIADSLQMFSIPTLASFGFDESHARDIIPKAKKAGSMKFNPVVLPDEVLLDILMSS